MTEEQIFKYLRGEASEEEKASLDSWLAASDENRRRYRFARFVFEGIAMHSTPDSIRLAGERRRRTFRRIALTVSGIAAAVAVFFISGYLVRNEMDHELSTTFATVEVPSGQRMDLVLEDGTRVKLNSGARLSYPTLFSKDARNVSLSGEAYFDVAREADRPFTVRTFASDVKVLGTEFSIMADEASRTFTATLVEGSVKVMSRINPAESLVMKPNDVVTLMDDRLYRSRTDSFEDLCWTKGHIHLKKMPFDEMMALYERIFDVKIVIERDTLPVIDIVSGQVRISDGVDNALHVLAQVSDFTYERDPKTNVIVIR